MLSSTALMLSRHCAACSLAPPATSLPVAGIDRQLSREVIVVREGYGLRIGTKTGRSALRIPCLHCVKSHDYLLVLFANIYLKELEKASLLKSEPNAV